MYEHASRGTIHFIGTLGSVLSCDGPIFLLCNGVKIVPRLACSHTHQPIRTLKQTRRMQVDLPYIPFVWTKLDNPGNRCDANGENAEVSASYFLNPRTFGLNLLVI